MKIIADLFILIGGPFQILVLLNEVWNDHSLPVIYGIGMILLNLSGCFYGYYYAKDKRYIFLCLCVAFLYFVLIV